MKLSEIKEHPKNPRQHTEEQIKKIATSIKQLGWGRPLILSSDGYILAGHGAYTAVKDVLHYTEAPVKVMDHKHDSPEALAYMVADNKLTDESDWNYGDLELVFEDIKLEGFDVELTGFNIDEQLEVETKVQGTQEVVEDEFNPDDVTESIVQLGQVWQLGNHRLMCGDSTTTEDVETLMNGVKADMVFTDPPYNTGMTPKTNAGSTRLTHIFNDDYTDREWHNFMTSFISTYFNILKDNSVAYIHMDFRRNHELIPYIKQKFDLKNIIVWDKVVHGLGSDYKYTYELLNVCKKGKPDLNTHQGDKEYSDVWHIQRKVGRDKDHATKKPLEIIERALRHASKVDDLIVDLFGGSGSTLIACEQLQRNCYMMELDPHYCDVIIQRWEDFTNNKAKLVS